MSTELSRLSELAKAGKTTRFLSLAHLLTPAALMAAFEGLGEIVWSENNRDLL